MKNNNQINDLRISIVKALSPLVPESKKILLLDFPDHGNVGDSAIWLGEVQYFYEAHNIRPDYVCTFGDCSFEKISHTLGTIFLHGGGNFGDIWPAHQEFRESVLQHFPNRPIVQLPQTLHFSNKETLEKTAKIINAHPDFTLLVRDKTSLEMAQKAFTCKIVLCPDMAFWLGDMEKVDEPSHEMLLLLRTDKEQQETRNIPMALPDDTVRVDWLEENYSVYEKIRRKMIWLLPSLGMRALNENKRRELLYREMAKDRVDRGRKLLSSGKFIVTDRLHVHILCFLMDIPHLPLDNNYGKVHNFINTWKHSSPPV